MNLPKLPVPLFKVYMSKDAIDFSTKVLGSGFIGQGPVVENFESKLKSFFNNKSVVTTNSATSAEHLVFHMLKNVQKNKQVIIKDKSYSFDWPGLVEQDHVLTTALTCTATNWPILANNLRLRWVDADPSTCNIDLDDLEKKINERSKVIMVVHWGGYPVDIERLEQIRINCFEKYGFMPEIIEDCAHAFGSEYKGKKIGTHGNICTFSFQAIKHLTSGDGGCIVLNDAILEKRAKLLRWFGINRDENRKDFRCEENIEEFGFKMHMNDINAAIGIGNLPHVQSYVIPKHKENANYYDENLSTVSGVSLLERKSDRVSSSWLYTMKVENQSNFMKKMQAANISVSRVHERNDIHNCVSEYKEVLPNLDKLVGEMICIPVGWWVSKEDREYIVEQIKLGW